jgi:hypothetical protein
VELPLADFGKIHQALLEAVNELERLYADE